MNPLYHKLTHNLDKISMMRRIFTQRVAARDGVCLGQMPVMDYIRRHPGCTQKDVADFMEVSPPSVAVMVKRMVRDGIIEKKPDEKDMRQNRLLLTEKGEELQGHCRQIFDQVDEQVYAGFSPEELELLSSFLIRLINNLANDEIRNTNNFALLKIMKNLGCSGSHNNDHTQKEES